MSEFESTTESAIRVSLPVHEVLISFTNDCGGGAFLEWWESFGQECFEEWASNNYAGRF